MNKTIGETLKENRQKQNLSIADASIRTKISPRILESIEANDFKKVKNQAFLMAHVKNYSKVLKLDQNKTIDILKETLQGLNSNLIQNKSLSQKLSESSFSEEKLESNNSQSDVRGLISFLFNMKTLAFTLTCLAIWLLVYTLKNQVTKIQNVSAPIPEKKTPQTIKPQDSDLFNLEHTKELRENLEQTSNTITDQKEIEKKDDIKINNKEVIQEVDKKEETIAKIAMNQDEKELFPKKNFRKIVGNVYSFSSDTSFLNDESVYPSNYKQKYDSSLNSNLYIYAQTGDTWLAHKVDDKKVKRYVLKAGNRVYLKGNVIRLFMGNINNSVLIYNNKKVKAYSKTGVKSLIFPKSEAKKYLIPLFPINKKGDIFTSEEYMKRMNSNE